MNNKEKMKRTYDEIHAPEALTWKVMDMSKEMNAKKFKVRSVVKYAICTLAIVALAYGATDGITYAATGEALTTKITAKIKTFINGEEKEQNIELDESGTGEMTIPKEDGTTKIIKLQPRSREELEDAEFAEVTEYVDENGNPVDPSLLADIEADGTLSYYGDIGAGTIVVELDENGEIISIDVVE